MSNSNSEPQNELDNSLAKAAIDPAHRPQFYRDFLQSNIYFIKESSTSEREFRIQPIEIEEKSYLPIFSSLDRLQEAVNGEIGYIAINAREFLEIIEGAEVVLNPASDYGKEFTQQEIQSILDGSLWQSTEDYVVREATEVYLGQPANYPRELVELLTHLFQRRDRVKKAYLAHFFDPQQDENPHTLIALEVNSEWEEVIAEAGLVAKEIEIPDPPLDFIQITGAGGGLEDYFIQNVKPFFEQIALS
ncbi:enhanced serine sensitivity protein SseB C-terminal domain-containing protein [Lusitaniella coriacea LEGE 07157]|uniref:Enhanced serine sensitivity protein SseB C-terminal domain-containing protein n=1 Tax=Lusitaniella coriacea LEGE 07157 TaxID=945747 RepID=A0A8J7AZ95_9CYAN|nr:enhanced serine sensitivity protein SseB C-terminal domain-containing protein [Lusitaniella coriacea]MBE9115424.1 enhanced serine sensitivity protein SseB C-terminal domain-containing protein [Lusitaniella coriacea LEGE 07157]